MTPVEGMESFRYVVMAARRARQLQNGSQPLIHSASSKACRVAQEEIAAGKVTAGASPASETLVQADVAPEPRGIVAPPPQPHP